MILSKKLIQEIINESAQTGCDFVEVFLEDTISRRLSLVGGKIDKAVENHVKGIGLRLALGANYVYGYTNKLDRKSVISLAQKLRESFNEERKEVTPLGTLKKGNHHKIEIYPEEVSYDRIVEKLQEGYKAAREYSNEITQTTAFYLDTHQKVLIAKMDGRFVSDERVYTRFGVNAVASDGTSMESGYEAPGRHMGFELFDKVVDPVKIGREAARCAVLNLHAEECPSGEFPVVIDKGWGGVLFHEAVGHSLEATSVARGTSVFCGKLGTRVANKCVSAVDDGTVENAWGSENFDDEGNKQKKRVLIKNGILVSYMVDELNGKRMGAECTASGRRESYKFAPTSRMSNTYIVPGKSTLEDMIKGIKFGIYAKSFAGGSVNPATGDFNFGASEAYLIEDGKITKPVKGASLIGNGRDTLANIDMVGPEMDFGTGMCGSASGSIPVNVGQPAIRVSKITVGGRKAK